MADIRKIMAEMEPRMRQAFEDAIRDVADRAQLEIVEKSLRDGRIEDAIRALQMSPEAFGVFEDLIEEAYKAGGRDALLGLPAIPDPFLLATLWCASRPEILAPKISFVDIPSTA